LDFPELAVLWLIPAVLAGVVASRRGASGGVCGLLAFMTGPFAVLVLAAAFVFNHHRPCPFRRKRIDREATKRPYCRSDVPAVMPVQA